MQETVNVKGFYSDYRCEIIRYKLTCPPEGQFFYEMIPDYAAVRFMTNGDMKLRSLFADIFSSPHHLLGNGCFQCRHGILNATLELEDNGVIQFLMYSPNLILDRIYSCKSKFLDTEWPELSLWTLDVPRAAQRKFLLHIHTNLLFENLPMDGAILGTALNLSLNMDQFLNI